MPLPQPTQHRPYHPAPLPVCSIDPQWAGRAELRPDECLSATPFIESDSPSVIEAAHAVAPAGSTAEVAAALFRFVRDAIAYEFLAKLRPEDYRASVVLARGRGFCIQKAVLLAALGRARGIPTAVVMTDLRDHTLPDRIRLGMGTDVLFQHALVAFHVEDRWIRADATLSPDLCRRQRYHLVEFDGRHDALLPAVTRDGRRHAEYLVCHGMFADLPMERMLDDFDRKYEGGDLDMLIKVGVRPPA